MSQAVKKLISLFSVLTVCAFMLPLISFHSFAADGVTLRLQKLKRDFPDGYYYNHQVKSDDDSIQHLLESRDEKYALSVTKNPCTGHYTESVKGDYDCNYFDEGYQCHGFASMLFYEIFGVRQSEMKKHNKAPFNIKPGDLVRVKNDSHSVIVLSVKGERFTVAECNVHVNNEAESCKIRWGESYRKSDISYYVRAENYSEISADSAWKNIEDKEDEGNSFYAAIYSSKYNKALTADGKGNVKLKAYTGSSTQVWYFTKLKNGSYKIENCKYKKVLGLKKNDEGRTEVKIFTPSDKASQKWAFYSAGESLFLSADSSSAVLTVSGTDSFTTGRKNNENKNLFAIKKKKTPVASAIKATSSNGSVSLSWSKGKYTRSFDVEIYDDASKLYKSYKGLKGTSLKLKLPSGNYSAKIISKNAFSKTKGNEVHFTVSKKGVLGKTAKVTATQTLTTISLSWQAVPEAEGYIVAVKNNGEWKTVATTKKTKCTVKELSSGEKYTFAVRAYNKVKGKTNLAKDMATFTSATKIKAPSKLTATQTTSSVTLKCPLEEICPTAETDKPTQCWFVDDKNV